jgi:phosphoribosylglycinamide formyltransferase 2
MGARFSDSPILSILVTLMKKILLLGSGELGKEFVIACQRLGQHVIAVDSYAGAPAMQVADAYEVVDMLNGAELDRVVSTHKPDIIVPEIEAIRTERFTTTRSRAFRLCPVRARQISP